MVMQYEESQRLTVPTNVQCLSFSKDGALIACGAANLIRAWRTSNGRELYNFVAVSGVMSVQWGDERTLYCGLMSGDLLIKVFDEEVRNLLYLCLSFVLIVHTERIDDRASSIEETNSLHCA